MRILLSHGSGGKATHSLIKKNLLPKITNPILEKLSDAACVESEPGKLFFTTDSFVVTPLEFPGGDLGKLSVCGTVNDLVVSGAVPRYLSLGLIIEEGLLIRQLERIIQSIGAEAKVAGVKIVAADTKVVEKGACDRLFINTAGIGWMPGGCKLGMEGIRPQDKVIITGTIGNHGLAVLSQRKGFQAEFGLKSDCASLSGLIIPLLRKSSGIKFMRDPTRGGLATTLNEIAGQSRLGITIRENDIPVAAKVRAAAEMLGIDPLYLANEGIAVIIAESSRAEHIVRELKRHPLGVRSAVIGTVGKDAGRVVLETNLGTRRILDMLTQEVVPRIC